MNITDRFDTLERRVRKYTPDQRKQLKALYDYYMTHDQQLLPLAITVAIHHDGVLSWPLTEAVDYITTLHHWGVTEQTYEDMLHNDPLQEYKGTHLWIDTLCHLLAYRDETK